ncbi:MAG: cytochrome c biogenesis protein CcsA [Anaerolineae bacterium]|nr:cytochrome c biogenesis protein CcsA [Anaerolineae bacterium]MDW8072475.1 cytochrome c biogenesis protein CcsA [Anaerolineae bacterium]
MQNPAYLMTGLLIVTGLLMVAALVLALGVAPDPVNLATPTERFAQRIFYFHVPNWWVGFLAYLVAAVAGALYLVSRQERWDAVGVSSIEIGLTFNTIGLISGSLWAKPTWNTWWTWEPRLTTAAIGWLMYVGYLMLRSAIENPQRRARFAAVFSILAFLDVPVIFLAVRWWRTIHPVVIGAEGGQGIGGFALGPTIQLVFFVCLGAFTLLYVTLLWMRLRTEFLSHRVERMRQRLLFR